jgi:hypothetical protein
MVQGQRQLFQVVETRGPVGRFPNFLNGRQQNADEGRDDGNHVTFYGGIPGNTIRVNGYNPGTALTIFESSGDDTIALKGVHHAIRSGMLAAETIYRLSLARPKPDLDRDPRFQERNWARLREEQQRSQRTLDPKIDRALFRHAVLEVARLPEGARIRAPFDGTTFRFKDDSARLSEKDGAPEDQQQDNYTTSPSSVDVVEVPVQPLLDRLYTLREINEDVAAEYAQAMLDGAVFPPIDVWTDGSEQWVSSGGHRTQAAYWAKRDTIRAYVHQGTKRDALLHELRSAMGMGGRRRALGDSKERARKAVSGRIRESIERLRQAHPELARHLEATVATGTLCSYDPDRRRETDKRDIDLVEQRLREAEEIDRAMRAMKR